MSELFLPLQRRVPAIVPPLLSFTAGFIDSFTVPALFGLFVAQVTGMTKRSLESTQVLIELATPAGQQSGLKHDSVVNCVNLLTLDKGKILRTLGNLPDHIMQKVNGSLKAALELS